MMRLLFITGLCVLSQLAEAQTVYKCSTGGRVSYGDRPCADGGGKRLPPPAAGVDLPEANTPATRDARTLLQLEKLRIAREKDEERQLRERQKLARGAAARRKACDKLRLRHKWAQEGLAQAGGKTHDAARIKLRRQAETLAVECPA
jgi:hypothetical protein